jgi:hypothetical protein
VDPDFGIDVEEVLEVIRTAEVFVVWFPTFDRRLLVDSRVSGDDAPLIRVVDRVRNAEERFRELRRLRPKYPAPDRIVAFQWPRSVNALVAAGIWSSIEERATSLGVAGSTCEAVLAELQVEERLEQQRAIRGEEPQYRTLWEHQHPN